MSSQKTTSSKRTGIIVGGLAAVTVAAAAFAGAGGALPFVKPQDSQLSLTPISTAPIFQPPPGAPLSFADIFERVSPAVVSIHVKSRVPIPQQLQFNIPGFPFDPEQFGAPQGRGRGGRGGGDSDRPRTREAQSSGSGFFISSDGYIVTNNHVVENATEITIVMTDKRELKATVIGTDEATDLAVLKVDGRNFPFVNFENSAKPRVGDWVITIGNPFDLGGTATAGIVSASSRNIPDDTSNQFVDFLQIDAAINRGNSGGPTFDVYGRVIGVNSAIYSPSPSGGSVGIGFAIPAEVADTVTKQLIAQGKVTRGFLGASVLDFSKELAEGQGDQYDHGAFVADVTKGGPAESAGLRRGDVVLSVNGKDVADATSLTRMVASTRTGDPMRLEVLREHRVRTITVRSGTRPSESDLRSNGEDRDDDASPNGRNGGREQAEPARPLIMGLSLAPLDDATRRRYGVEGAAEGILVTAIDPESPLADQLRRGDVISMARGATVTTPQQFVAAVEAQQKAKSDKLLVIVTRGGETAPVLLDLSKDADED